MAMRAMASRLLSPLKNHPWILASSVILLFALPIFHVLMFFWPLIVSTVLGVLAVVSFARQSDEHVTPCDTTTESRGDISPSFPQLHEEKISNVLMVGNQEVTWLEWLHHEDTTQKLCAHECEPAMWDVDGGDVISLPTSEVSDVASFSTVATADTSTGKHVILHNATLHVTKNEDIPHVWDSRGDEQMTPVSALASTKENAAVLLCDASEGGCNGSKAMQGSAIHAEVAETVSEGEIGVHACELSSVIDTVHHTSKPKIAPIHEQDVLDTPLLSKNSSPFADTKGAEVCEMQSNEEQEGEEEGKCAKQVGPQWDVSDGEEDRSSLRFSFFHHSDLAPSGREK